MEPFIFPKWNCEQDVIVSDAAPLLSTQHPIVARTLPWAYAINTAKGFFCMGSKRVTEVEKVDLPGGKKLEFSSTFQRHTFLVTDTTGEQYPYMHSEVSEDVWVWSTDYFDKFLIVTFLQTDQTVLIDSRGIPFELPLTGIKRYHRASVELDMRNGCYIVEKKVQLRFRTLSEQQAYSNKTQAGMGTRINKAFGSFCRGNTHNESTYLYLTVGESKCSSFVNHFVENGMEYEVVPNLFEDDATLNIRIPLAGHNAARTDVAFLCAKYHDEYSIYNVPYTEVAGILKTNRKIDAQCQKMRIFFSSPLDIRKETISYYIINTLYSILGTQEDYEIFKASISKIMRLFWRTRSRGTKNIFTNLLFPHPAEVFDVIKAVSVNQEYADEVLAENGYTNWETLCKAQAQYSRGKLYDDNTLARSYQILYECAKSKYKRILKQYEDKVAQEIVAGGGLVGGWTNEALLYKLVRKEYPDAVFQYHAAWLGNQSLDIYIPSLRTGIEYQGEQHYHPIAVFGGESGFIELCKRDEKKRTLCRENKIRLIYWKYDEPISLAKLRININTEL